MTMSSEFAQVLSRIIRQKYDESPADRYPTEGALAEHVIEGLRDSGYEVWRVAAECWHCGEAIEWEPDFRLWFHLSSGIEHCYRDPQHTEMARPRPAVLAVGP